MFYKVVKLAKHFLQGFYVLPGCKHMAIFSCNEQDQWQSQFNNCYFFTSISITHFRHRTSDYVFRFFFEFRNAPWNLSFFKSNQWSLFMSKTANSTVCFTDYSEDGNTVDIIEYCEGEHESSKHAREATESRASSKKRSTEYYIAELSFKRLYLRHSLTRPNTTAKHQMKWLRTWKCTNFIL